MVVNEKIKPIDNKIQQNKLQYDLDRQAVKISALSSGNVGKNEFFTGEDVLLLLKAATIKSFQYPPLDSELKKQTSITEKQYQELDKVHGINKNTTE